MVSILNCFLKNLKFLSEVINVNFHYNKVLVVNTRIITTLNARI